MFIMKESYFFVTIVAIIIMSKDCGACFREDDYVQSPTLPTGSSFYQECHCLEPGYNVQNLKWLDTNNNIITAGPGTGSNIYIEHQSDSINLHIPNISKTISGTYKCITQFDGQEYVQTYKVDAYDPVYFFNTKDMQLLVEGNDSTISCEAKGESNPLFSWQKGQEDSVEIKDDEKYQITPQGLFIRNVTKDDGGIYSCTALVMSTGEEVAKYIKVEIITLPVIKKLKAVPEATVVEGEQLSIECIAESTPFPEYVWNKGLEVGDENRTQTWRQVENTIVFDEVHADDRGIYECRASNLGGNDTKKIFIEVLLPPKIIEFDNITAIEGAAVPITCNAIGYPTPYITIGALKDDFDDEGNNFEEITGNSTLIVNRLHEGVYFCNASNEVDSVSKKMYMTILHKPYIEKKSEIIWAWNEKTINFTCAHKSNPSSLVTWRYQGNDIPTIKKEISINRLIKQLNESLDYYLPITIDKDFQYGVYGCIVENIYGKAIKTVLVKEGFVPPPIKNVSVINVTATSVIFSIEGPHKVDGPDVLGFTAEYDISANYNITNIHVNRTWSISRPYKLDKLKPNTTYLIKFAALNDVGAGPWSETLEFHTFEKSVPDPPAWEEYVTQNSSNHVLKWRTPDDNGDPIDHYVIRYCPIFEQLENKLCKEERIEPTTELELSNLDHNTTYFLELVAHNSEGYSTAANISFTTPGLLTEEPLTLLSAGTIIGIAVVIVLLCLLLLDLTLLLWRRQGIIASCCFRKNEKTKEDTLQSRDKKGLLRDNAELADETLNRPNKGHKEYEYNKNTGIITGKHSAV